jgi:chloramphenicol 3-O phosphotransferase
MTQVIVLNGGSSAGKSSIARALQDVLPGLWLTFGTDVLAEALPGRGDDPRSGLVLEPDGTVRVKPEFRAIEAIWYQGLAAMASREAARPDRVPGMAVTQAEAVHAGVVYDVEVDTTNCSPIACARRIAEAVTVP